MKNKLRILYILIFFLVTALLIVGCVFVISSYMNKQDSIYLNYSYEEYDQVDELDTLMSDVFAKLDIDKDDVYVTNYFKIDVVDDAINEFKMFLLIENYRIDYLKVSLKDGIFVITNKIDDFEYVNLVNYNEFIDLLNYLDSNLGKTYLIRADQETCTSVLDNYDDIYFYEDGMIQKENVLSNKFYNKVKFYYNGKLYYIYFSNQFE